MELTTHSLLVLASGVGGAIPLPPICVLLACYGEGLKQFVLPKYICTQFSFIPQFSVLCPHSTWFALNDICVG